MSRNVGIDGARPAIHEPFTCDLCEQGQYVLYENDKVCRACGYVLGTGENDLPDDPWERWRIIRNTKFEEDQDVRKRVVGSYQHAYTYGNSRTVTGDYGATPG